MCWPFEPDVGTAIFCMGELSGDMRFSHGIFVQAPGGRLAAVADTCSVGAVPCLCPAPPYGARCRLACNVALLQAACVNPGVIESHRHAASGPAAQSWSLVRYRIYSPADGGCSLHMRPF